MVWSAGARIEGEAKGGEREQAEKERDSREIELRILGPKEFQPLHDERFACQSLLYISGQGEPAGPRSVRGEASLFHLCLPPIEGNREQRASQRAGLTRWEEYAVAAQGSLSWKQRTERGEERFQEREVHKWEVWALCEWESWGCQGPRRQTWGTWWPWNKSLGAAYHPWWSYDQWSPRFPDPLPRRGQVPTMGAINLILTGFLAFLYQLKLTRG